MSTSPVSGTTGQQTTTGYDAYNKLNADTFMKMLISELQSQDPLNPMSNSDMVNQISQIRAIQSNTQLTTTLESMMLGDNMSTAANLLNRTVYGLDNDGKDVFGVVSAVYVEDGVPKLSVNSSNIELKNVRAVISGSTGTSS